MGKTWWKGYVRAIPPPALAMLVLPVALDVFGTGPAPGRRVAADDVPTRTTAVVPQAVLAEPLLGLGGVRLRLRIECDTPATCALARGLWRAVGSFAWGSGE